MTKSELKNLIKEIMDEVVELNPEKQEQMTTTQLSTEQKKFLVRNLPKMQLRFLSSETMLRYMATLLYQPITVQHLMTNSFLSIIDR